MTKKQREQMISTDNLICSDIITATQTKNMEYLYRAQGAAILAYDIGVISDFEYGIYCDNIKDAAKEIQIIK